MTAKERTTIKSWLTSNGYSYKTYDNQDVIMVNTNYSGAYPKDETYQAHNEIGSYIRRFHRDLQTEERGFYTGLLIYSKQ